MKNGLKIGDILYEFFAWSNSQLTEHGCWMYAADLAGNTAESLRRQMGDLEDLRCRGRCVAKYMARLGQNFSQTTDALELPLADDVVTYEGDIERGMDPFGNTYCFSDGIGKMSEEMARKVNNNWK